MSACKKKGSKSSQTTSKKDVSDTKRHISELSSTLTEMKACIAAFCGMPQGTNSSESNSGQKAPVLGDAENSFCRHASNCTKIWLATPPALLLIGLMMFIRLTFWHY